MVTSTESTKEYDNFFDLSKYPVAEMKFIRRRYKICD